MVLPRAVIDHGHHKYDHVFAALAQHPVVVVHREDVYGLAPSRKRTTLIKTTLLRGYQADIEILTSGDLRITYRGIDNDAAEFRNMLKLSHAVRPDYDFGGDDAVCF